MALAAAASRALRPCARGLQRLRPRPVQGCLADALRPASSGAARCAGPGQLRRCSGVPPAAQSRTLDANELDPKVFAVVDVKSDSPGILANLLKVFSDAHINISHIESRLKSFARDGPAFHIDFEGEASDDFVQSVLKDVKAISGVSAVSVMPPREVPWFPLNIRDLDLTTDTLDGGTALINEDHPGFSDQAYRRRREEIVTNAAQYRHGDRIPRIKYFDTEVETWQAVYGRLQTCHAQWACAEYLEMLPQMERYCGYAPGNIPQLADISEFLQQRTGFTLRPISGLLSARDFLNALAFRVFYSTQYIRHHGNPFYTPEPDICHELLGHVPLFANPAFADFSQEIGLASLAASDDDIARLAAVYWFTVEFGLLREGDSVKAYGAGLLSSFGEMEWSCAAQPSATCREMGSMADLEKPSVVPLDPWMASKQAYPITTYQPTLFCADSLKGAKVKIEQFCDTLMRPFFPQYDPLTQNIRVTKAVRRAPRLSTVELQKAKQQDYFQQLTQA
uniref:phenylalanine 4-monooxygenase n=1 Tax=Alexandrium catenella TaxID=2925 RepID=A0A7S1RW15_ALECA